MKGAIYIRSSNPEPTILAAQVTEACRIANARGIHVAPTSVFVDFGSGCGPRPELAALVDAAADGLVEAVIVTCLSRFGRSFDEVQELVEFLRRAGVTIVCGDEVLS
jgi:DNA invertase Pin-like site-specific DNA recombinase